MVVFLVSWRQQLGINGELQVSDFPSASPDIFLIPDHFMSTMARSPQAFCSMRSADPANSHLQNWPDTGNSGTTLTVPACENWRAKRAWNDGGGSGNFRDLLRGPESAKLPFLIDDFCKGFRKPALERGIRHRERIWMNEIPFNEAVCQIAQNPEVAPTLMRRDGDNAGDTAAAIDRIEE